MEGRSKRARIEGKRAEGATSWGGVETVPSLIRQEERYDVDEMMLGAGQSENWSRGKYYFRRHSADFLPRSITWALYLEVARHVPFVAGAQGPVLATVLLGTLPRELFSTASFLQGRCGACQTPLRSFHGRHPGAASVAPTLADRKGPFALPLLLLSPPPSPPLRCGSDTSQGRYKGTCAETVGTHHGATPMSGLALWCQHAGAVGG